jgi:hypothetical protein
VDNFLEFIRLEGKKKWFDDGLFVWIIELLDFLREKVGILRLCGLFSVLFSVVWVSFRAMKPQKVKGLEKTL